MTATLNSVSSSHPVDDGQALEELLIYLQHCNGFDFTGYKRETLGRRIRSRMTRVGIHDFCTYLDYLKAHPKELSSHIDAILINVTGFFRDPEEWRFLRESIVPRILQAKPEGNIRVWVPGCASGEEVYAVAMIFADLLGTEEFCHRVVIFGTDADENVIECARPGLYDSKQLLPLPNGFVSRFFTTKDHLHQFRRDLRHVIVWNASAISRPIKPPPMITARCRGKYFFVPLSKFQDNITASVRFNFHRRSFFWFSVF